MPTKIGDEYLKVTNAWNGKLLVASSCEASAHADVLWFQGAKSGHCQQKPAKSRNCFIIRKEHPWDEFDSGACVRPVTLNL